MRSNVGAFRAIFSLSTAAMIAVSYPLWISGGMFPRVPFVAGLRVLPVGASWIRFTVTILALGTAAAGLRPRASLGLALGLSAWMVLEDQFRLQPWMYQFFLMGLTLVTCPPAQAMGLCRLFVVAMYVHSALSKFDVAFVQGTGNVLIGAVQKLDVLHPLGRLVPGWVRPALVVSMPLWELVTGLALAYRRTWRIGVSGAVILHVSLLILLGPWFLDHSTNVLIWNVACALEVFLLFRKAGPNPNLESPEGGHRLSGLTRTVFLLALLLPFGERAGLWDTWPSFALYAQHNERISFQDLGGEFDPYPPSIRPHMRPFEASDGLRGLVLDLQAWSLAERRVPVYPQGRALNGVAEALAARYGGSRPIRVVQFGRAGPWTGRRATTVLLGLREIRAHGDSYRINAHPSP